MRKKTIGLVGRGFVGGALYEGFKNHFNIEVYDLDETKRTCSNLNELVGKTDTIFLALPTPMILNLGECDTKILESVLNQLDRICEKHNIVIKSTTPPNKIEEYEKKYKHLNIIANPEFLRESSAVEDFLNQDRIILGGKMLGTITKIYKTVFPDVPIYKTNAKTAMASKYFINCFLATKVSFANEFRQVMEALNIEYNQVKELALLDKRIGKSHLDSPGSDKLYGFSKSCFPKDLNEIKYLGDQFGVDTKVLDAAWNKNLEVRPEKDWEQEVGRAVSKNNDEN